jgi:hypothetical protein
MIYNEILSYNEPSFRYDGVRVVTPESIGLSNTFGNSKVLAAFLISPISIDTSIIFVGINKVILPSDSEVVTTTSATISFEDPDASGYIAFNVLEEEAEAILQAETIYVQPSGESTFDISLV